MCCLLSGDAVVHHHQRYRMVWVPSTSNCYSRSAVLSKLTVDAACRPLRVSGEKALVASRSRHQAGQSAPVHLWLLRRVDVGRASVKREEAAAAASVYSTHWICWIRPTT